MKMVNKSNEETKYVCGKTINHLQRNKIKGTATEELINDSKIFNSNQKDISIKNILKELKLSNKLPIAYIPKKEFYIELENGIMDTYKKGIIIFEDQLKKGKIIIPEIKKIKIILKCKNPSCFYYNNTFIKQNRKNSCIKCGSKTKQVNTLDSKTIGENLTIKDLLDKGILKKFNYEKFRVDNFQLVKKSVYDELDNKLKETYSIIIYETKCYEHASLDRNIIKKILFYPLIINYLKNKLNIFCDNLKIIYVDEEQLYITTQEIENMAYRHGIDIDLKNIMVWYEEEGFYLNYPTCEVDYNVNTKKYSYKIKHNDKFTLPLIIINNCNTDVLKEEELLNGLKDGSIITNDDYYKENIVDKNVPNIVNENSLLKN